MTADSPARAAVPFAVQDAERPGRPTMIKLWSELPIERLKEQLADVATAVWLLFWGGIVWQLFDFLAGFAEGGRLIRTGGQTMVQSGRDLGDTLADVPFVGGQLRDT